MPPKRDLERKVMAKQPKPLTDKWWKYPQDLIYDKADSPAERTWKTVQRREFRQRTKTPLQRVQDWNKHKSWHKKGDRRGDKKVGTYANVKNYKTGAPGSPTRNGDDFEWYRDYPDRYEKTK